MLKNFLINNAKKVPEITVFFWIVKILTTAMGESTSDFLVRNIDPIVAVLIGGIGFTIAILLQFWVRKYIPWVYWLAVTMVAIFGTMVADVVHIVLGVPYILSSLVFAVLLTLIFLIWYKIEKSLSIHSIYTFRRELFYWGAVVVTFALGTATGDLTAVILGLGYLLSGILFAILFIAPFIGVRFLKLNRITAFWFAYIMTRPFGASFADWFGRTHDLGGVGFGTGKTSLILTFLIVIFVIYLSIKQKNIKSDTN